MKPILRWSDASAIVMATLISGCGDTDLPTVDPALIRPADVAAHFRALPEAPDLPDPAALTLGKALFWDPVLSGDQDVACASCHHPNLGYGDGRAASAGVGGFGLGVHRQGGAPVPRNSPTLINVLFNGIALTGEFDPQTAPMFWDNREQSLEEQALEPIISIAEMRGNSIGEEEIGAIVIGRLIGNPEYVELFASAYGNDGEQTVSVERTLRALADFQRSLTAVNSPFDRFMRGDLAAMSDVQITGMQNFIDAGCALCHNGPMFSDYQLHVLSAPDHPDNASAPDTGADNRFAFRTPTLRNLSETAPFLHSGAMATLTDVMAFYEDLEEGRSRHQSVPVANLDPLLAQVRGIEDGAGAILSFLEALNDPNVDRTIPESVPSGLPPGGRIQ